MNDDYLWDRTGKPDPEIQKLENILGELRYQPRPLEIPMNAKVGRKLNFFGDFGPRLAIAATIAMLVVGLGIWFAAQRLKKNESNVLVEVPKSAPVVPEKAPVPKQDAIKSQDTVATVEAPKQTEVQPSRLPRRLPVGGSNRLRNVTAKNQQLTAEEREGEAAKNQLMLALRLASAKLNFAQKKTQSSSPREQIHNQHKIG